MNIYLTIGICFCAIHILLGILEGGGHKGVLARLAFAVTGIVLWPLYLVFYILGFIIAFIMASIPWQQKDLYKVDRYWDWHDGLRDAIDDLNKKVKK